MEMHEKMHLKDYKIKVQLLLVFSLIPIYTHSTTCFFLCFYCSLIVKKVKKMFSFKFYINGNLAKLSKNS